MNKLELQIKGIHGGVLITLPVVSWFQQRDLLIGRIQTQERFFKGGRMALDVGSTDWSEEHLLKLLKDLADEGVCLWTILSTSEKTKQAAEYHGFPTTLPDPSRKPGKAQQQPTEEDGVTSYACLERSLAEGEHYQHSGDLLMVGDIPKDAKVEVSGSLVLWGTLYGIAVVNTSADSANSVRILKIEGGQLIVDGKEVEIPAKLRKKIGLVVSQGENGFVISNLKPRRLL